MLKFLYTITYPTSLDSLSNPSPTDNLENSDVNLDHDKQHSNANDAIEALEAKVGADGSVVTTSHDYKLGEVTGSDKAVGKTATQTLSNKTLTSPILNLSSNATGDIYYRASDGTLARLPIGTTGNILDVSASGVPEWVANPSGTGVQSIAIKTYLNAASPATWTKPAGLKYIIVEVQAGGGGGGGTTTAGRACAGGGGGGYSKKIISAASLGATETVTIGAGGTAGSQTGGTGGTGGTSSFGSHCSATGGGGGTETNAGGAGGSGSSGDINCVGGGGSGGSTTGQRTSGIGGSSILGGGGVGIYDNGVGTVGGLYGGGGAGAMSSGADQAGGVGGAGIVIVTEYLTV